MIADENVHLLHIAGASRREVRAGWRILGEVPLTKKTFHSCSLVSSLDLSDWWRNADPYDSVYSTVSYQ